MTMRLDWELLTRMPMLTQFAVWLDDPFELDYIWELRVLDSLVNMMLFVGWFLFHFLVESGIEAASAFSSDFSVLVS